VLEGSPAGSTIDYTINGQAGNSQTDAGTYTVTAKVTNPNYITKTMTATLVIKKAQQTIAFDQIGTVARDVNRVAMKVGASSGLSVSVTSDDPMVATVDGSDLLIHRLGTIRLTATQAGDKNHEVAAPVSIAVQVADEAEGPIRVQPALSPNGDGINDFLVLEGIKDYAENKLQIVTRNGLVVFKIDGYDNDSKVFKGIGNMRGGGGLLPEGTYFYVLEYKDGNKKKVKKGWFVLKM
jgi:gliding motility-associated-like protein